MKRDDPSYRRCDISAKMKVLELYSGIGGMHFAFKGVYDVIAHTYMYVIYKE